MQVRRWLDLGDREGEEGLSVSWVFRGDPGESEPLGFDLRRVQCLKEWAVPGLLRAAKGGPLHLLLRAGSQPERKLLLLFGGGAGPLLQRTAGDEWTLSRSSRRAAEAG